MGIDTAGAQLLFGARAFGADFTQSLMIGRQFFYPDAAALQQMFRLHGIDRKTDEFLREAGGWGEALFRLFGAHTVSSMDVSAFEGADVVHDLNAPIGDAMKGQFSVIYDGGTLEHVFDLPQALRNCMEMLREGGWFIQMCPANNFMGHGFYQISPELVYRVFTAENGFEVVAVLLQEAVRGGTWYSIADPADVGRRVQMTNRVPVNLCTVARRVRRTELFRRPPQQSDYSAAWQRPGKPSGGVYRPRQGWRQQAVRVAQRYFPARLERLARGLYTPSLAAQPDCYRRISVDDLILGNIGLRVQPSNGVGVPNVNG